MDQIPAAMDRHLEVVQCHPEAGILLGASSLTGRYWYGSLWYYQNPDAAPEVERCTAGVQLEAGLSDACWVNNNKVIVGMDTGGVALWELTDNYNTFIQQNSATEHDNLVSSVCVCHGGSKVISGSHDNSVKIWDLESFISSHTYKAHSAAVHCVHCHPTQTDVFLTASQDGSICLWDTRNPKPVSRIDKSPLEGIPTCVAWQPGVDHMFAVGSEAGQLVVKDTRAAVSESITCIPHHRNITRLTFSSKNPNLLASVSDDCTVVVTDIADDKHTQIFKNTTHTDFVHGVSWRNDGQLFTCSWDGTLQSHNPSGTQTSTQNGQPAKMEVNGEPETGSSKQEVAPKKCLMNGGGDHKPLDSEAITT